MKDPSLYEDSDVLINLRGIKEQKKLDDFETTMTRLAIVEIELSKTIMTDVNSIFWIHQKLFERVHPWAGQKRTIDICKDEMILDGLSVEYSHHDNIESDLFEIQKRMDNEKWEDLSEKEIVSKIALYISDVWKVHSFREGNTRTVAMYLYMLAKGHGMKLDSVFISQHSKYFRNALVMASLGEYRENQYLEKLIAGALLHEKSDEDEGFETINGYNMSDYRYNYHHRK